MTFQEARAQVITDYQAELEERLVTRLRAESGVRLYPERLRDAFRAERGGLRGERALAASGCRAATISPCSPSPSPAPCWRGPAASSPPAEGVARVGNTELTAADLERALAAMPPGMDSLTARDQYVEQWLTNQLLAQEARRRGLVDDPDVQRQLADNERNVLSAALLGELYDRWPPRSARRPRDVLQPEPRPAPAARAVRPRPLRRDRQPGLGGGGARRAPAHHARRRATPPAGTRSSCWRPGASPPTPRPRSRWRRATSPEPTRAPGLRRPVGDRRPDGPAEISPVIAAEDSTFYVIQLVERIPAGEEPELEWMADEIRRRVAIQNRQLLVAREVQRLRTEAEARGDLRVRDR
jgi:peptidyl-prolyl cis-trans isomerase C